MQSFTANQAKTQFGQFLDTAQREPVQVMRHDRVVGVMVSAKDYEAMRLFYADRLQHRLAQSAQLAEAAGLTKNKLDELLSERD
jgi:PHD/YefM family antitoxin component YafN of YafNO toxin-antitoxin module